MKFVIAINAPPESQTAAQALDFAQATLKAKHTLTQIFFYGMGVRNTVSNPTLPLTQRWQEFISHQKIPATACVNSFQTYFPATTSSPQNLHNAITIAGMAQLVTASAMADRTLTFGLRDSAK